MIATLATEVVLLVSPDLRRRPASKILHEAYVAALYVCATTANEHSHVERHVLNVSTQVTRLCCGLPLVNLDQSLPTWLPSTEL